MSNYVVKTYDTSVALIASITDTTSTNVGQKIRVAGTTASGTTAYIVAYANEVVNGQNCPVAQMYRARFGIDTTFTVLKYCPMWVEVGVPFVVNRLDGSSHAYVPLANIMSNGSTGDNVANCVALVDCTTTVTQDVTVYPRISPFWCVLDSYTSPANRASIAVTGGALLNQPFRADANLTTGDVLVQTASVSENSANPMYKFGYVSINPSDRQVSFSNDKISSGTVMSYDGRSAGEAAFIDAPSLFISTTAFAGGVPAGTYLYTAYYEYTDSNGNVHRSRTALPYTVTLGAASTVNVGCNWPTVSMRNGPVVLNIFRTKAGGTQYYRVSRVTLGDDTAPLSIQAEVISNTLKDNFSDATIGTNPLLFRQPGTFGTGLDRYHSLYTTHCIEHKDRTFYCRESTVYYSSFDLDGEGTWFNPAFKFPVPGGTGKLTALASLEGSLVAFKTDSVFLVDGDGPPENGGNGTEFSPPRRLGTQYGCTDHKSLISTDIGLMYRSERGIELMARNFSFKYIGEPVAKIIENYPITIASTFDRKNGRAMWLVCDTYTNGYQPPFTSNAIVIVYDIINNAWTTQSYEKPATSAGASWSAGTPLSMCYSSAGNGGVYFCSVLSGADSSGWPTVETWTQGYDSFAGSTIMNRFVPVTITTGWVKSTSKQERIRLSDLIVMGTDYSNFNISVDYKVNYERNSSWATIKTFTATDVNILEPVVLEFQPPRELATSVKFRISTSTPTGATALGTGRQLDFTGITVKVGIKGGGAKLPAAQKG